MIQPKDLISENILYSTSWKYKNCTTYVYLTKNKLYQLYKDNREYYGYSIGLTKNFNAVHCFPDTHLEPYIALNVSSSQGGSFCFQFPHSETGAKIAEELLVAISKAME